jgi:hypothetical protein
MNQQPPTEEQHGAEERKHRATLERRAWWLNFFTGGVAFVGLVGLGGLVILYYTLQETKTATMAANRAWLSPIEAHFDMPAVGQPFFVEMRFQNSGHEPAVDINFFFHFDTISNPQDNNILNTEEVTDNVCDAILKPSADPNILSLRSGVLPPGGSFVAHFATNHHGNNVIWDLALDAKHTALRAKACTTYKTFNVLHYTRSCRVFEMVPLQRTAVTLRIPGIAQGTTPAQEASPDPTMSQGVIKREQIGIARTCNGGDSAN